MWRVLKILKIELSHDLAISLMAYIQRRWNRHLEEIPHPMQPQLVMGTEEENMMPLMGANPGDLLHNLNL